MGDKKRTQILWSCLGSSKKWSTLENLVELRSTCKESQWGIQEEMGVEIPGYRWKLAGRASNDETGKSWI
jgi:hypothetical protein